MDLTKNSAIRPDVLNRLSILDEQKEKSPFLEKVGRNLVIYLENKLEQFMRYHRDDRRREDRNHKFYTALDYSQWPDEIKSCVASGEDSRDLSQYNFLHKKVLGFVGMMSKNPQEIDFISQSSYYNDASLLRKKIMLKDKELCNWEEQIRKCTKNGIIYSGYLRVGITKKHNELGNIELKAMKPGTVLTNPNWDGETMEECQSFITTSYLTAYEAKEIYKHKSSRIDHAIRMMAESEFQQRDPSHAIQEFDLNQYYEQKYRFIEYHHMVDIQTIRLIAVTEDGTYVDVPNPPNELQDQQSIEAWLNDWYAYNNIDKKNVIKKKSKISKYYVATSCHALDSQELFENNLGTIQCGRLPMVKFAYDTHLGRDIGVIDMLADPQVTFNSRMSMISEIIGKAAKDGYIYEPNAFGNDPVKMKEFEEKSSTPGFAMAAAEGYIEDGNKVFAELPNSSGAMQQQANSDARQMFDIMSELTPQNKAMEGINESYNENARLFQEKKQQGEVNMDFLYKNMANMMREIGEIYYAISDVVYGKVYRRFVLNNGEEVEINKPSMTRDGIPFLENDISLMPRQEVVITQSKAGLTFRTNDIISSTEMVRILPNEASLTKMNMTMRIIENLDNYSTEDKDKFMGDINLEKSLIESQMLAQKATNDFNIAQAQMGIAQVQMQMAQMQAQMQGQGGEQGAEGEGQQGVAPQVQEQMTGPMQQNNQPGKEQLATRSPEQVLRR